MSMSSNVGAQNTLFVSVSIYVVKYVLKNVVEMSAFYFRLLISVK